MRRRRRKRVNPSLQEKKLTFEDAQKIFSGKYYSDEDNDKQEEEEMGPA